MNYDEWESETKTMSRDELRELVLKLIWRNMELVKEIESALKEIKEAIDGI